MSTTTKALPARAARTNRAQRLFRLSCTIVQVVGGEDAAIAEMKALGAETDDVKQAVISGHMFRRINGSAEVTQAALAAIWEARNEPAHKVAYAAARKHMERLRKHAGVEASDNRGGARQPVAKDGASEGEGDIPIAPPAKAEPNKYDTEPKVRAQIMLMAQTAILAFAEKQRNLGTCGDATMKVVHNIMKQIPASWRVVETD